MRIQVLDHGYVEFVEAWGSGSHGQAFAYDCLDEQDFECGIIEAARQSTQGSFRGWSDDAKLLHYLYTNNHATPFEFAGLVIEVQAPIFVFREWHRHRTQSYNEMSARYSPLTDLTYLPDATNVYDRAVQAWVTKNKQAGSDGLRSPSTHEVTDWLTNQQFIYQRQEAHYQYGLKLGIPKELARIGMPVGHYSRMRAHANLRAWLGFLTLRLDTRAQWEIRQFADAVGQIIKDKFPQTWNLFNIARQGV